MADNTTELEVLDQIVDVLGGQSGQYETVVPTLQQIRDLLGGGGGGGGYNPSLSVGRADALTGADSTAQWAQRTTEGSGAATVRSVQGAAVAFNQLRKANAGSSSGTYAGALSYKRNEDGSVVIGGETTTTYTNVYPQTFSQGELIVGHKYLVRGCCPPNGSNQTYRGGIGNQFVDYGEGGIATLSSAATYIRITVEQGVTVPETTLWPQLFDLTQMFGSGNEPATVAEFERMYPEAYYPYSAPTLKPVQIAGIASTDAQGGELDSVEWPTFILRGAGAIGDMLYSDHVETRVGVVDLGAIPWSYNSSSAVFNAALVGGVGAVGTSAVANIKCARYDSGSYSDAVALKYGVIAYAESTHNLYVRDPSYTSAADLKTSLAGVLLYYELATPTTTPISPALPMTYKVQAGGSESIIVPEGEVSAAPVLTVAEGESAADVVMDALACIATPDGPTATANHAINTYLTMGGKLYKVTRAIAAGETIAAGTNVTQTTVMAELIARTA